MILVEEFTTKEERHSMTKIADLVVMNGNYFLLEFLINMCFVILCKSLNVDEKGSLALMAKVDDLFVEVNAQRIRSKNEKGDA